MARVTHATPHLPIAEVKNRMRTDPHADGRQRWLIIYNASIEPRTASEIARHCGVSKATVHAVISRYNRLGASAIETPGRGGRRRQYLTLEEEQEFLAPFFAQAESGEIATVGQIWHAFEQCVGHTVDDSTIYRLLHRHGWRKLMPRPRHPKSDLETQEQFKKTFPTRWKQPSLRERQEMSAQCSSWRKTKAVLACVGYLGHPFAKKMGVLIIFSYLSELWLSQIKGYLNISHVSVHHVDTVHLRFQWKLTGRKFLSSTPKTCGTRNARSSGISLVIL